MAGGQLGLGNCAPSSPTAHLEAQVSSRQSCCQAEIIITSSYLLSRPPTSLSDHWRSEWSDDDDWPGDNQNSRWPLISCQPIGSIDGKAETKPAAGWDGQQQRRRWRQQLSRRRHLVDDEERLLVPRRTSASCLPTFCSHSHRPSPSVWPGSKLLQFPLTR